MTKENLEEANGGRDRQDWFKDGDCPKFSKKRWREKNYKRNGISPANSVIRGQNQFKTE